MADLTKAEIRDRCASDLGIRRIGQSIQYQDQVRIEQAYDEVYQDLKTLGLATWASTGNIPAAVCPYISGLMALNCSGNYSIPDARMNRIILMVGANGEQGKTRIKEILTPRYESVEDPLDY